MKVKAPAKKRPEKLVGALLAGLSVLRYLAHTNVPVGVSRTARDLKISPSTCFNLLRTLVHERIVEFDPIQKTYSIGFGLLELAKGMIDRDGLVRLIRPKLDHVAAAHRVTTTLWRRIDGDRAELIERADSASAVRVHMTIGQRLPLFVGALGRCFAGFSSMTREEIRRRFDLIRWENPPEFEDYWREVQSAKNEGYAIDRDHFVRGVTTIACPVLGRDRSAIMAISAIGFTGQFTEGSLNALVSSLLKTGEEISHGIEALAMPPISNT